MGEEIMEIKNDYRNLFKVKGFMTAIECSINISIVNIINNIKQKKVKDNCEYKNKRKKIFINNSLNISVQISKYDEQLSTLVRVTERAVEQKIP